MCARWIQLATFYPFARQHRDDTGGGGENGPYVMDEPFKSMARSALHQRLQYTRQLYSCLYEASRDGGTCFDPLMFHFPMEDQTFSETEHSFIFANALKITPVLDAETSDGDSVRSYFPEGTWVNMNNYSEIIVSEGGELGWMNLTVDKSAENLINTHLMPGAIVTKQEGTFFTTQDIALDKTPFTFIANRDKNGAASTKIYLDDGESLEQDTEYYNILLSANSIKKWNVDVSEESKRGNLLSIVITNAEDLKDTDFACMTADADWAQTDLSYSYNDANKTLTIST